MRKLMIGLAVAGLTIISGVAIAGLWPGFPIVGIGTVCWGSTSTATGTLIGVVTGCPNQAPAGPTVVSGNELIPADVYNASTGRSGNPATVLLSLASLNALPISVFNNLIAVPGGVSATNTSGGVLYTSAFTFITSANVTLPSSPIDGQQYRISSNRTISTLNVTAATGQLMGTNTAPTMLSAGSATAGALVGFTFMYNAANNSWYRLQ